MKNKFWNEASRGGAILGLVTMAFSLLGLKHDVEVENGECFDVSFPNFIELMGEIGIEMELK